MKQQSKCERANESTCNRPWTKINHKTQDKYPVSIDIMKSLRRFCIAILQYKVMLHSIAFKVSQWIMNWA